LGTLLVGSDLAERADLQEKFVTNNERYQKICQLLEAADTLPNEKLIAIESLILALKRYHFVASGPLIAQTVISAARHCADTLLKCGIELSEQLSLALQKLAATSRRDEELVQLEAIKELASAFNDPERIAASRELSIARELVDLSWMDLFQRHFWLLDRGPQQ
jgi:hypothetical protein